MRIGVGDEVTETSTGGGFNVVPKMLVDFNALEQLKIDKFNAAIETLRPLMPEQTSNSSSAVTVAPPVEKKSSVTMVLLLAAAVGVGLLMLTAKPVHTRHR